MPQLTSASLLHSPFRILSNPNQPYPFQPNPQPTEYAQSFHCIGPACEDSCCQGWSVHIDQATYEKYQKLPPSPLRTLIDASILLTPAEMPSAAQSTEATKNSAPACFAQMRMTASGQCPLLGEDRLCQIQSEVGEELLSRACATYPRVFRAVGGEEEIALSLSCPEAARLVLLTPDLQVRTSAVSGSSGADAALPLHWFWSVRKTIVDLLRNRAYPLWQRLFLLGVFCRRLDSIAKGELRRSVPEFLADFEASVAAGGLRTAMETLPSDRKAQLDAVLRLSGLLLHRSNVTPRFAECVQWFATGIVNGPGATLDILAAHYEYAHQRYYAPFFARHPQIMENYLINTIVRSQFPFGLEAVRSGATALMSREYALLTAQFALMKGLLIGVAGCHREGFSPQHVVQTVQAASKHFEHHTEFLNLAHQLLVESQLDGARGLAILLRNQMPRTHRPSVPEIRIPASLADAAD